MNNNFSKICTYDPLKEILSFFGEGRSEKEQDETYDKKNKSIEERLKLKIIDGDKTNLEDDLKEALDKYTALEIVNSILLDAMKTVGELFGSGKMQLPFVLQSAEVMKSSVNYLEQFMEKKDINDSKGLLVLATVKGDVHDIGKNLVDIILTNNGYKVINLGIKCPIEKMIEALENKNIDALGMSGLLVKSTLIMKENLEILNERNISIPVILGGAALTRRYVDNDLKRIYNGDVHYAQDAFDGLKIMQMIKNSEVQKADLISKEIVKVLNSKQIKETEIHNIIPNIKSVDKVPIPPFFGTKIVDNIDLNEIFKYINETALIKGQWQVRKRKLSEEEYAVILKDEIYPTLNLLKKKSIDESLLQPKAVYGYFKCMSDNNDLIIYDTSENEIVRFSFPRQRSDRGLCISDYFKSKKEGNFDIFCGFFLTVGKKASEYSKELYDANKYSDYLYFHGLSVETAEAFAEYLHKQIRSELNIHHSDSDDIKRLFSQGYQGSRYSFGYPACPNLEDQIKLKKILHPEIIGIEISEEYQLIPEQSVSAIVVHHPEAKYFNL